MVMDKGLSIRQAENFLENSGEYVDIVKLGFGTSYMTKNLQKKIDVYKSASAKVYVGGTLFEAFYVRGQLEDFLKFLDKFDIDTIEISDGSMSIPHDDKCELIQRLSKNYLVLSEVGSKEEGILISPAKWIRMMKTELEAGSWKVIAEARESGTVGIYRPNGTAHVVLINKILAKVDRHDILWEAPQKSQQAWFVDHFGVDVNLGNISASEVIPLETLRLGLRGDTFFTFLPDEIVTNSKP
jgi:phosphosulfolactate synthase